MAPPLEIDPNAIITKNRSILASQIDTETVMMDVENGLYYGMNQVGSRIWALLDTPHTLFQLEAILFSEFDVAQGECLRDIQEFVSQLIEKKLVRI